MKKITACMLILLSLPAAIAGGSVPGPTPPPGEVADGGVPAYTLSLAGVDASEWKEAFLSYAEEHAIPVEEGGFALVGEWPREGLDVVDYMYRVMAGGAEVFVQVAQEINEKTVVQFVIYLDYDAMTTDALADTLAYYYPLVMRACIFASELGATEEAENIQRKLCPDISGVIHNKAEGEAGAGSDTAWYFVRYGGFGITAGGCWEVG